MGQRYAWAERENRGRDAFYAKSLCVSSYAHEESFAQFINRQWLKHWAVGPKDVGSISAAVVVLWMQAKN